jgi:type II secretory pathway pseudopilin PulG
MKKNIYPTISSHAGFTLLETLFAILIFSAALISLMAISSKGISATNQVKNETTAFYLAQEGLEVIRNIRDSNFNASSGSGGATWNALINQCEGVSCEVVYNGLIPSVAPCQQCEVFKNSAGSYVNGTGTPLGFTRELMLTPQGTTQDEYLVTSRVRWQAKNIERQVELQTILKKWQ